MAPFDLWDIFELEGKIPDWWRPVSIYDFVKAEIRYRDPETGRFISYEEALRRYREGEPFKQEVMYRAVTDYEPYGLKKGRLVSKATIADLKEEVKFENTIRGVARTNRITDRNEAVRLVERTFDAYERGEIDWRQVHEIFSP